MLVSLRPVSRANVRAVCELRLGDDQDRLVAPAAYTVAEAHYEPRMILRAIYADDEPVGVLLVDTEGELPLVVRFMIDCAHQRRGIGRQAVELLADELGRDGWRSLEASFVPVADGAEGFWRRCGFQDTGRRNWEGEPIFARALSPGA